MHLNDILQITDIRVNPGDSAFLIDDGTNALMYDSGFGFTGYAVADKVQKILGGRSLQYIFLTHSHYDHAYGSAYVSARYPDVTVVAGEYAASVFDRPSAKTMMRKLDRTFADKCGVGEYEDRSENLRVDIAASDGDVIGFGDLEFEVLNLPGHTKCSIGYYCPQLKLLLGCETLGVFNGEDDVVPACLVGYQMTVNSIKRVKELDIENILVPHFGLLDIETSRFYLSKALESTTKTASEICTMIQNGNSKTEIVEYFKTKFYKGYIKEIYPVDAMELNTGIMINLFAREICGTEIA